MERIAKSKSSSGDTVRPRHEYVQAQGKGVVCAACGRSAKQLEPLPTMKNVKAGYTAPERRDNFGRQGTRREPDGCAHS